MSSSGITQLPVFLRDRWYCLCRRAEHSWGWLQVLGWAVTCCSIKNQVAIFYAQVEDFAGNCFFQ